MRKNVFGRRLKRDKNERKALFKGLMSALILYGRIKTTESKAKAIKGQIDKVVNKAKKDKEKALLDMYLSARAIRKLRSELVPQLAARSSGYTRLIKIGQRFSDNAPVVLMEWVDKITENRKLKVEAGKETQKSVKIVKKTISRKPKISKEK